MSTREIVDEFVSLIEQDKAYSLKELKDILGEIYKTKTKPVKTAKPVKTGKAAKAKKDEADMAVSDEEKPVVKAKKAPSAYNNFIKKRIEQLKIERTDLAPRDLLKHAAGEWKQLDKAEQEKYKMM